MNSRKYCLNYADYYAWLPHALTPLSQQANFRFQYPAPPSFQNVYILFVVKYEFVYCTFHSRIHCQPKLYASQLSFILAFFLNCLCAGTILPAHPRIFYKAKKKIYFISLLLLCLVFYAIQFLLALSFACALCFALLSKLPFLSARRTML